MVESTAKPGRRPARPGAIVAVLMLAGMTVSFMQTILIPIQGELPRLLGAPRSATAWVITVTLLVAAFSTPITGKLGDMFGKRRVILVLLGVLALGSVVCALSTSVVPLIVGRALQGFGLGVIALAMSILRDTVPAEKLPSSLALISATLGVGGALGMPISAIVTQNFEWHMLFWLATALATTALLLVLWIVPESPVRSGGRVDVVGVVGLALGLTGILLAVSRGNDWGWTSPLTLGLLIGGVVVLLVWGRLELRMAAPLVDLRVTARGPVLMTNLASIVLGFALYASQIVFPQLLVLPAAAGGMGLTLLETSLVLIPAGFAMLLMSPVSGQLQRRWGPKPVLALGTIVIAVAYLLAVLLDLGTASILVVNLLIGTGIGLGFGALPALIMRSVPVTETGAATGLNNLMRALGTTTAAAVIATVLASSAGPSGLPSSAGFHSAFLLGLGASVACAVLVLLIPRVPAPGARPEPAGPAVAPSEVGAPTGQ